MPRDGEADLGMVEEHDFASPTKQRTFGVEDDLENGYESPRRTQTGLASIDESQYPQDSRPSSWVGSMRSNLTNGQQRRSGEFRESQDGAPSTRPVSFVQTSSAPRTRNPSFEYPDSRPGTGIGSIRALPSISDLGNHSSRALSDKLITQSTHPLEGSATYDDVFKALHQFFEKKDHAFEEHEKKEDFVLGEWLVDSFRSDLFSIYCEPKAEKDSKPSVKVNIAGLQRMRMRKLQSKLVDKVVHMRYKKTEPKGWEDLLEQYITATKDYDYIRSCVDRGIDDPFVVITERVIDREVLRWALSNVPEDDRRADNLLSVTSDSFASPFEKSAQPIGGTRLERTQKQEFERFLSRLAFGLVGGVFLIGPMWLMVMHNTKYTALISTSVFVIACGVLAAWKLSDPISVLSTTAAYAAVLVVFVGTNSVTTG